MIRLSSTRILVERIITSLQVKHTSSILMGILWYVLTTLMTGQEDVDLFKINYLRYKRWTTFNTPCSLSHHHRATLFHPEYGVIIANKTNFDVRYENQLLLGNLQHGMVQVQMRTSRRHTRKLRPYLFDPSPRFTVIMSLQSMILIPSLLLKLVWPSSA